MVQIIQCPNCKRLTPRPAPGVRPCKHCGAPSFFGRDRHGCDVQIDCRDAQRLQRIADLEEICPDVTGLELGRAIFPDDMPTRDRPRPSALIALTIYLVLGLFGLAFVLVAELVLFLTRAII